MESNRFDENGEHRVGMMRRFRDSAKRGRGASATELIILLVLIALVCLGIFRMFGETIKDKLTGAQAGVASVGSDKKDDGTYSDSAESGSAAGGVRSSSTPRPSGVASSDSGGGTGSAMQGSSSRDSASTGVEQAEAKPGSVGGFNPWILAIFIGLSGLLVYVFFAKKSS